MAISISHSTQIVKGEIQLASSKSLSNRALIIRALCEDDFEKTSNYNDQVENYESDGCTCKTK